MTYNQKKVAVLSAVRRFKKNYRQADTMGERLERELERLLRRKQLIEPSSLRKTVELVKAYSQLAAVLLKLVTDLVTVSTS